MIIYGTRTKVVQGPVTQGQTCPHCGEGQQVAFGAIRYAHIFWIPVFPLSKKAGIECTHCKHAALDDELPDLIRDQIKASVFSVGRLLPMFTGSALLAVLFGFLYFNAQQDEQLEYAYVQEPVVNDLYIMDFTEVFEEADPEYKFGVMRVVSVDDSDVEVSVSNYSYDRSYIKAVDLRNDMASADFFAEETLFIDRESLLSLQEDGTIRDVRRP